MILDFEKIDDLNRYKIMSGTIVPRPIAWIVTEDDGVVNAAPFSYFIPLSSNPATVLVAIGQKSEGIPKDTLANILKTKKATICFASKDSLEKLKLTANTLEKEDSEIEKYTIEVTKPLENFPPMISSTQSALFCEYYSTVEIPGKTTPVILEIKKQFIEDDRINEKNHIRVENVGREGFDFCATVKL